MLKDRPIKLKWSKAKKQHHNIKSTVPFIVFCKLTDLSELIRTYLSSLLLVLCRVAAVKRLAVHHYGADDIFWSLGLLSSF